MSWFVAVKSLMRNPFSAYLDQVHADWVAPNGAFEPNIWPKEQWPIPFFGNPKAARVLTVGVNPSSQEFLEGRNWSGVQTSRQWKERLRDYFVGSVAPHEWFDPWTFGLGLLDLSYKAGTAAHVDVSYRPTFAMCNDNLDPVLFRLLPGCPHARLLLTFGPILRSDGSYEGLPEFILATAKAQPHLGFDVGTASDFVVLVHRDTGRKLFIHEAISPGEECVGCSVAKNLHANRERLTRLLERTGTPS